MCVHQLLIVRVTSCTVLLATAMHCLSACGQETLYTHALRVRLDPTMFKYGFPGTSLVVKL